MNLRVLSYNIHRAIGIDRRFRPERIVEILEHHQPDIALLQEVDVGVPRSRHLDMAKEIAEALDFPHYAVGLNVKLSQGHYGNATLSRHPIVKERNIDLTIEERKRRGCLYTQIEVDGNDGQRKALHLFNLHLGLSFKERPQQVGVVVRSAEFTALDNDQPCLVGGDFNDWWTRIAPIFTEALRFKCATNHRRGYQNAFLTYPSFSPTSGLDKIFCRGKLRVLGSRRCKLSVSKVASDHLPVIVDLELL